ncbi:hypothetical protein M758_2G042100 [Ceratodon purpureus]|nr:hypothetical protein M758_2G042100 [Ceratodon purpureus]KAG0625279.1 hypothetical protein M758_2G042100 [Ceratodon purpureus]
MASSLAYTLCIVLCICSLQTAVSAKKLEISFYTHEIRGGPNGTLLAAAGTGAGNFSALGWGSFLTIDNIITEGPNFTTTVLGKFTGFAVMTTKGGLLDGGILVLDQFRFGPASKYNGSSISVTGNLANPPPGPWEVIVLGGTGYFRGYTGYAFSEPYLPTTLAPRFVYKWTFYLKK